MISICIPTYNRARLLALTLASVRNQTIKDFEVIVCNDGSTDNTQELILNFKFKILNFKFITHKKNKGYTQSILECAKKAKGDWIFFLSDDDIVTNDFLETYIHALSKVHSKNVGMVTCQVDHIDASGVIVSKPTLQLDSPFLLLQPKEFIPNYTLYPTKILNRYTFNTAFPSTMFRRDLFLKYYKNSAKLPVAHDLLITSKLSLLHEVLIIDKPLLHYRMHDNWGSSLNSSGDFLKEYRAYLHLLTLFIQKQNIVFDYDFTQRTIDALVNYLVRPNGGMVRMASRYRGSYNSRIRLLRSYVRFSLSQRPLILLKPTFYITLAVSLLPQTLILQCAKLLHIL